MEYSVCSEKGKTLHFNLSWVAVGCHSSRFVSEGLGSPSLKADNQYFSSKLLKPL